MNALRIAEKRFLGGLWLVIMLSAVSTLNAEESHPCYAVRVATLPQVQYQQGEVLCERLKKKGYLSYYYLKYSPLQDKVWCEVQVGCYRDTLEARRCGEKVKKEEGLNYVLDTANVFVDSYRNRFEVITTPSAIWLKKGDRIKELYPLHAEDFEINDDELLKETRAVISPSGKDILFYFDFKIIKINLKSSQKAILEKGANCSPQWSYRGDFIGYMDGRDFEAKTSLWVMRPDGTRKHCLVKHQYGEDSENTVKSFHWHSSRNMIIFVEGYTWGTVTVGGNIYAVDMQGNQRALLTANRKQREEITSDFYIRNDFLVYQIAHFDKDYMEKRITIHKLPLSDLFKE